MGGPSRPRHLRRGTVETVLSTDSTSAQEKMLTNLISRLQLEENRLESNDNLEQIAFKSEDVLTVTVLTI